MPILVIRFPDGNEQERQIDQQLTVGRAEGNDLILIEGGVSRKHARFYLSGALLMVEDVGSANGTFVDSAKIDAPTVITGKSQVVIGDHEISVRQAPGVPRTVEPGMGDEEPLAGARPMSGSIARTTRVLPAAKRSDAAGASALAKRVKPSGAAAGPMVRGLNGAFVGLTFPLEGKHVVGRVEGVDIRLDDDSVSRRHAEMEVRGRAVFVRDLGSANGTAVNGAAIDGEATLENGDIIQFGVLEFMYETGAASPGRPPPRRTGAIERSPKARRLAAPEAEPASRGGVPPAKKRLFIAGIGAIAVLLVAVVAKIVMTPEVDPGLVPTADVPASRPPTIEEQVEQHLAECRSFSAIENGTANYERAAAACQKAVDLDPISAEANSLLLRIQVEKTCQANLEAAIESLSTNHLEEALESFAKIRQDCKSAFVRAIAAAQGPVKEVTKQSGEDCRIYAANQRWDNALRSCEIYARLACQAMADEDLYPPALSRLSLEGRLGANDWRPKDPLYLTFLRVRAKVRPSDPTWQCPSLPVFRTKGSAVESPGAACRQEFEGRWPHRDMVEAVCLYYSGKLNEAPLRLQKLQEKMSLAEYHLQARNLQLDLNNIINLYQAGSSDIANDRPDKAEVPFRKALALDAKVILGERSGLTAEAAERELEKRTSFVRRAIIDAMSQGAYRAGRTLLDRKDGRGGCKFIRLGLSFSRTDTQLLRATLVCSQAAQRALGSAATCEAFRAVLDIAMPGDGVAEQAEAKLQENHCN
jgi:pSer/pThr/pTyr-binding forkhead associated (FHA) protein/tetratricopeptide (TPR) repeat protein